GREVKAPIGVAAHRETAVEDYRDVRSAGLAGVVAAVLVRVQVHDTTQAAGSRAWHTPQRHEVRAARHLVTHRQKYPTLTGCRNDGRRSRRRQWRGHHQWRPRADPVLVVAREHRP